MFFQTEQAVGQRHPCFFSGSHLRYGRIHLPVAPSCNIQCAYCRRDYACVNENRPGVSNGVITPEAALERLERALHDMPYITVAGIAGPGDAFSQPELTLETFALIRRGYPELALCISTNGLMLVDHIPALVDLKVGFVTVTINAVDPVVGAHLYQRVTWDGEALSGPAAAGILIERQLEAVAALKKNRFTVKVNSVVVPGINEAHTLFLAKRMHHLGVDLMNLLPLIPVPGTALAHLSPPSRERMQRLRDQAGRYLPQMKHCRRCRADAVGRLGEDKAGCVE